MNQFIHTVLMASLLTDQSLALAKVSVEKRSATSSEQTQSLLTNLVYRNIRKVYLKHLESETNVETVRRDVLVSLDRNYDILVKESRSNPKLAKKLAVLPSKENLKFELNAASKEELLAFEYQGVARLYSTMTKNAGPQALNSGGGAIKDWMDMQDEDGPLIAIIILPFYLAVAAVQAMISIITLGQYSEW